MKVLVTGHEGYIGSVLTPMLIQDGHEVVGLDTGFFAECTVAPVESVPTVRKDLRSIQATDLAGIDAVVHLAALSNDPLGFLDPELTYEINFGGSVRLALAAKEAGVDRFLFSSSCSLYGKSGDLPVDESSSLAPITPYAESKAWFERALVAMADHSFSPLLLRNATAHGWSPRLRGDLVVHDLLGAAISTGKILIKSDGTPWRPLVHVEDISSAFLAGLGAPREDIHCEAVNIGKADQNFQVREIAEVIAGVVPGSEIAYAPGAASDKRDYRVDFTKLGKVLPAYQPKWTLEASVRDLYHNFIAAGISHDTLTSSRCTRLARISELTRSGRLRSDLTWADV